MRIPALFPSTFVCPTEIIAFSDKANEFHDVNCEVVAVSVDTLQPLGLDKHAEEGTRTTTASALVSLETAGSHERPA